LQNGKGGGELNGQKKWPAEGGGPGKWESDGKQEKNGIRLHYNQTNGGGDSKCNYVEENEAGMQRGKN
jgi:hypothetical protein